MHQIDLSIKLFTIVSLLASLAHSICLSCISSLSELLFFYLQVTLHCFCNQLNHHLIVCELYHHQKRNHYHQLYLLKRLVNRIPITNYSCSFAISSICIISYIQNMINMYLAHLILFMSIALNILSPTSQFRENASGRSA